MSQQLQPSLSLANGKANGVAARNSAAESDKAKSENSAPDTRLEEIEASFRELLAGPRTLDARAAARSILASYHPNHHLVSIEEQQFDLKAFTAAGHATSDVEYVDNCYDVGRKYKAAYGGRTNGKQAQVTEKLYWARSKFTWKNHDFLLYHASYKMEYDQDVFWQFLLYPRDPEAAVQSKSQEIDDLLLAVGQFSERPNKDIFVFEDNWTYRDEDMYRAIQDAHWDDVIIDPEMKNALMQDVISFFEPATRELYLRYSLPYKRGVILHGSPGNGKTITIKAMINHLQSLDDPIPTMYVKSMKNQCQGDQESLKTLFRDARSRAPLLLVLEDLDSLVHGDIRSHFLNEIDGLQSMDGILILGSTNHLSSIDSAISSRPSRFDRKYAFELPDRAGRERYVQHWRGKLAGNPDVDFPDEICAAVADLTPEFSFAYLKELFVSSLLIASRGAGKESNGAKDGDESGASGQNGTSAGTNAAAGDVKGEKESDKDSKHIKVPEIDVPETLKTNAFFSILQKQVGLLIKDMNDATEKEAEAKKEAEGHSCSSCWYCRYFGAS